MLNCGPKCNPGENGRPFEIKTTIIGNAFCLQLLVHMSQRMTLIKCLIVFPLNCADGIIDSLTFAHYPLFQPARMRQLLLSLFFFSRQYKFFFSKCIMKKIYLLSFCSLKYGPNTLP